MSKRAYFGTDGIRGQANRHPMTAEVALRVGMAAGNWLADQPAPEHGRQHFGDLGLADARFAFEEQRSPHFQGQEHCRGEAALGDVIGAGQQLDRVVDGRGEGGFAGMAGFACGHGMSKFILALPNIRRRVFVAVVQGNCGRGVCLTADPAPATPPGTSHRIA